ncbi:MAG: GNAT family N-acetyltransferase [Armatimonadota bacterium]
MKIKCRPMTVGDYGVVECQHWGSAQQVRAYAEEQGIASMLAFEGEQCVGQLYLKEYDPEFREPGGWTGERCWADFQVAEPLDLEGRFLTLGCYHVGEPFRGRGVGKALLEAVVGWCRGQQAIDGLVSWGLVSGSWGLIQWAGQMPHTVYGKRGFREIKKLRDPGLDEHLGHITGTAEGPTVLRVMLLARDAEGA